MFVSPPSESAWSFPVQPLLFLFKNGLACALLPLLTLVLGLPAAVQAQAASDDASETPAQESASESGQMDAAMEAADSSLEDEAARQLFVAGRTLYQAGRFAEAAAQWRSAYDLSPRAPLLYNIYVASRDAGQLQESANALRQYLTQGENIADRPTLEARLASIEAQLLDMEQSDAAVREAQDEAERARAEQENALSPYPWLLASLGGALLLTGTVTGFLANGAVNTLEDNCPGDVCPPDYAEFQNDFDSATNLVTATDLLFLSGGIIAGAGLIWGLYEVLSQEDPDERLTESSKWMPKWTPSCSLAGCGVTLQWPLVESRGAYVGGQP